MSTIDPAKAVNAFKDLEALVRGLDPQFGPPPKPAGIKASLGALAVSHEHASAALAVGQNVDALLMLARRQMGEVAITLANIKATMPPNDDNSAAIKSLIEGVK
jgi:hypothetical protein